MFVFSNLAMTLDGKIAIRDHPHFLLGSSFDKKQMQVLRAECDGILIGAATLRAFPKGCLIHSDLAEQPLQIILSSKLEKISMDWEVFKNKKTKRILFVTEKIPLAKKVEIEKTSEIILLKKSAPIASQIIQNLRRYGIKRLLIEGGGELLWEFVKENLIDEYHVTLTPKLMGGRENPSLVQGAGFLTANQILKLKLTQCQVVKDELYLIYRKDR